MKDLLEIIAYFAAACFFLFRAYSGAFYSSLSLTLNCEKRKKVGEQDILVVDLGLTGSEFVILNIHQIQGKISYHDSVEYFAFEEITRLWVDTNSDSLKLREPWTVYPDGKYHVSVKESTSFSTCLVVPPQAICKIEIVVIGRRQKLARGSISQWRVSKISLPIQ